MKIRLPDNSFKEMPDGSSALDLARAVSEGLARAAVAARINGVPRDLMTPLSDNDAVQILKFDSPEGKEVYWHTSAHIMAQAVKELFPDVKFAIGPAIDDGFYYDFDTPHAFTPEDFGKIENKVKEIVSAKLPVVRRELSRHEALEFFNRQGDIYKAELIRELPDNEPISIYSQGSFTDLCRGPHLPDTGRVKAFKILSVAGAYWRGSEKNKMLQRIYAVSFPDGRELKAYLTLLEEAKKRDHRKIGRELDLFSIHEEGPGFPFFHHNGTILYNTLVDYMRSENSRRGYTEIRTPIILSVELWQTSGHYDNFREAMYFTDIDERRFAVKPMNCPGGLLVYRTQMRSYRDLPLRQAEFGPLHRHERSGVLSGLFRVRTFTQDDAHSFCTPSQLNAEILGMVDYLLDVYRTLGFGETEIFVATRPIKSIGSEEDWALATTALEEALKARGIAYKIKAGEGAFYGPKIEFNIKDCLKRNWQCGTVQVDFSMPKRFGLEYTGEDGAPHTPVMIHRAILGSIERFLGVLIEHYAGDFPLWLAPQQAVVIPVSEKFMDYAGKVAAALDAAGVRSRIDRRDEKVGYKIRDAENRRIPVMLVAGEEEAASGTVSVRRRKLGDQGRRGLDETVKEIRKEIDEKRLPPAP